jgi:GNAT superfamily N-acetyltransferase
MISVESLSGNAAHSYLVELARLRIAVFRDFPYLYDGDLAYETNYLQTYFTAAQSIVVLVKDAGQIVGASTAIPAKYETLEVQKPILAKGFQLESVFYCGESVLLPQYRGQGIGRKFFEYREAHAGRLGGFTHCCFCAVQRPEEHPLRPKNYQSLDTFWQKQGYAKQSDMTTSFMWREVGELTESPKPLTYWMKTL